MNSIKLILSYHKPAPLINHDALIPLHVGRFVLKQKSVYDAVKQKDLTWLLEHTLGDDTGDNISYLNPQLNELTGMYWVWKNYEVIGNPEYIGFMHYRRFFSCNLFEFKPLSVINIKSKNIAHNIRLNKLLRLIQKYDAVIPKTGIDRLSNYEQYKSNHIISDLDVLLSLINEKYPYMSIVADTYISSFRPLYWNMFVLKRHIFFDYCNWLFDIVFEFQERVDISRRSPQEQRAFWSERLTGIYLSYLLSINHKISSLPIVWDSSL